MRTQPDQNGRGDFRRVAEGLFQYEPSGAYYARFRHKGQRIKERLGSDQSPCTSLPEAKRLLRDLKNRLDKVEINSRKKTFRQLLDEFEFGGKTPEGKEFPPILSGAPKTLAYKKRHLRAVREKFPTPDHCKVADITPGHVSRFMGHFSEAHDSHYNQVLTLLRDLFKYAVEDGMIDRSPVEAKYKKRRLLSPRQTPSWEEFQQIVAQIRHQKFSDTAKESADLVEFMGCAGLGQAECAALSWGHINFTSGRIVIIRKKTGEQFTIPIYPLIRPLLERMNQEREEPTLPTDPVFKVKDPKKSLAGACEALGLPSYSPRALRRLFITRALELGISAKVIAGWQGHNDGGSLVLKTYSHVRPAHEADMAALLVAPAPAPNVIPIKKASAA